MTSITKNEHIDKLDDIVTKCNNPYHEQLEWNLLMQNQADTLAPIKKLIIIKILNFKTCDMVRISKYKNIFAIGYVPNWSEEVLEIKNVKNTVPWAHVIIDLNG